MKLLLINQFFYPDVAATAQYASDLAAELARTGHEVTVIAGNRAYGDPNHELPRDQLWNGIRIHRLPHTAFGKGARWRRAADSLTFYAATTLRLLTMPPFEAVLALTSPPLISCLGAWFVRLKGGELYLWVMDLNPDQAIAAGWLQPDSLLARCLKVALRYSVRVAERIVVLDRFMRSRLLAHGATENQLAVVPPWSHDEHVQFDPEGRDRFRRKHGIEGMFVVMYSGNHSPCHPLDTLLDAARLLTDQKHVVFCFVGGGAEFHKVVSSGLPNILCLPYQPQKDLSASLSAADLHVIVMGDPFVGIVHPCKIYNVLRLGTPFLCIGPAESHITDMLPPGAHDSWAHVFPHGDPSPIAHCIAQCAFAPVHAVSEAHCVAKRFSRELLLPAFLETLNLMLTQTPTLPPSTCNSAPSFQAIAQRQDP